MICAAASNASTFQIVAAIVQSAGVIVALAALVYTVKRDRAARLAEIRTGFLRDAYLRLSEVTAARDLTPDNYMGMALAPRTSNCSELPSRSHSPTRQSSASPGTNT